MGKIMNAESEVDIIDNNKGVNRNSIFCCIIPMQPRLPPAGTRPHNDYARCAS
jgi:hypothetical protein